MLFSSVSLVAVLMLATHHSALGYRFTWSAQPVLALIAGIFILIRPKLLNFIVAIYLIILGIIGILHLSW